MPLVSPHEIAVKAEKAYPRFLKAWMRGEGDRFFPHRLRVKLTVDSKDIPGTIAANNELLSYSKAARQWGYTVICEQVRTRDFGNNRFPKKITIDTLDDLLRLAKKADVFAATCHVVERVRAELPRLNDVWLVKHVQTLHRHAESIEGLICVAQKFLDNPQPDCYGRQLPVQVDTKFIERHQAVLRQWLDLLLPASAIDVNESKFARRFGLRDGQPHRAIRLLDPQLRQELGLPFEELSLPLRSMAKLPVQEATVLIVENDLNLLTLPPFSRGIGLRGEGDSVSRLEGLRWLETNCLLYWGDIDVEGLLILSRVRNFFPHVESLMMDRETLQRNQGHLGEGNEKSLLPPTNLTPAELAAFEYCSQHHCRLEQERIPQAFVDQAIGERCGPLF